ncbi:hypothetical protein CNMCM6106_005454 [Aspergillus hiratsukae]|uniref:LysM domain-containing protein n=1 Tax=Aspergillus hiratsukae TaxID=1194566 RepID=A0A8H6PQT4_9EURO|nr:hypothetical protein CNMCM6106_005454 [Aspergillus hiratsukae]
MVTPFQGVPTYARDNVNGFLSSILAWLGGAEQTAGQREFPGFSIYASSSLEDANLPLACKTSLAERIKCYPYVSSMMQLSYHGSLDNDTLTDSICDASCGASLQQWYNSVERNCAGYMMPGGSPPVVHGAPIIDSFTIVDSTDEMPVNEICSYCYVERLQMMQRSPYSAYDEHYKSVLETINKRCGLTGPTEILEVPMDMPVEEEEPICLSDMTYTTVNGDTYNCTSIEYAFSLKYGDVRKYNPWVSYDCDNIQIATQIYGTNICLSPQGGEHTTDKTGGGATTPSTSDGHVPNAVPPPANAILANGTTTSCGRWHEATADESCVAICVQNTITHDLFVEVNPSLDPLDCTGSLQVGKTYCTGPTYTWNAPPIEDEAMPESPATA